ncbi:MAG: hypothetical protein J6X54_02235 [Treponema sp.]|nr:hypothetical protein [Treponema sp.]
MKKRTLIILIAVILLLPFFVLILLGWEPRLSCTKIYSTNYDNMDTFYGDNYEKSLLLQKEHSWDDIVIEVITGSKKDNLYQTYFPTGIAFNFITRKEHEEGEFSINRIELRDANNNLLDLHTEESLPLEIKFYKFSDIYMGGIVTKDLYYFNETPGKNYKVLLEIQNNFTKEKRIFDMELQLFLKYYFGSWKY